MMRSKRTLTTGLRLTRKTSSVESAGIQRRDFIAGTIAVSAACLSSPVFADARKSLEGLRAKAARKGLTFGTEVTLPMLESSQLRELIVHEAAIIEPGVEMKWGVTEAGRGHPDFSAADTISDFAQANGLGLRGHSALWYRNVPKWALPILDTAGGKDLLLARTAAIVGHFRGRVVEWDVVNEAINPKDRLPNGMRNWPAFAKGDLGYIAESFQAAASADPSALLFYNDYGFVYDNDESNQRRKAALRLVASLVRRNVPIHGFGLQCHLIIGRGFNPKAFSYFLEALADLGLRISLTELDVEDGGLGSVGERDGAIGHHTYEVLSVALRQPAVKRLLTWGVTDRFTWLSKKKGLAAGSEARPLPYDKNLGRKPLWFAIARALDEAPARIG